MTTPSICSFLLFTQNKYTFTFLLYRDGMGGFNNTIKVDPSDKEVFEALDTDSTNHRLQKPLLVESIAADTDYGQRIPDFATEWPVSISKDPPTLPPQLGTFNLPIRYSVQNLVRPFLSQNSKFDRICGA